MTMIFSRVTIVTMISISIIATATMIFGPTLKLWSYLLELSIVRSLSDGVPQRDLSIAKQTNLVGFDLWAGEGEDRLD